MKIYVIFIDTLYYKCWNIMVKKFNYIKNKKLNN